MRFSHRETGVPYLVVAFFWVVWIGIPALLALSWMGLIPESWWR